MEEEESVESGAHHTLVLGDGDAVTVKNIGAERAHFILVAGETLHTVIRNKRLQIVFNITL